MKKNIKRILILLFILAVASPIYQVLAATLPNTIEMSSHSELLTYDSEVRTYLKKATINSDEYYVYCLESHKHSPSVGSTLTKSEALTSIYPGVAYILNNQETRYTEKENYYITQAAIWWYFDKIDGVADDTTGQLSSVFKQSDNIYAQAAKSIATAAVSYQNQGHYSTPSFNLSQTASTISTHDNNYFTSDLITISATTNVQNNISYTLNNAPTGTIIVDDSDKEITSITKNTKFRIKVPVSSIKQLTTNFSIQFSTQGIVSEVYRYTQSDSEIQDVVPKFIVENSTNLSKSLSITINQTITKINKKDNSNNNLAGAHLVLKDKNGKIIDEWDTTSTPHPISGLIEGDTYTIEETKAPDGYTISEPVSFVFENEKEYTIYNMKTSVTINKLDKKDNKLITDAHLILKDKDDNIIDEWDTTKEGHVITGLTIGETYYIYETKYPDGYQLNEDPVTFIVLGNKEQIINVYNVPTQILITKVDKTKDKLLSGAHLVLKDKAGNIIDEWDTSDKEHVISGLVIGKTYYIYETKAPNGYQLMKDPISFTVTGESEQAVVIYNEIENPKTGDFDFPITMVLVFISAGAIIVSYKKLNEKTS